MGAGVTVARDFQMGDNAVLVCSRPPITVCLVGMILTEVGKSKGERIEVGGKGVGWRGAGWYRRCLRVRVALQWYPALLYFGVGAYGGEGHC